MAVHATTSGHFSESNISLAGFISPI